MDTAIIVALIGAGATVAAAVIAGIYQMRQIRRPTSDAAASAASGMPIIDSCSTEPSHPNLGDETHPAQQRDKWPISRTRSTLLLQLERTSNANKKILLQVADSPYVYVTRLIERTQLSRGEIIYRGKELEAQQLIEIVTMTDIAFSLHAAVGEALGDRSRERFVELIELVGGISDEGGATTRDSNWFFTQDGKTKHGLFAWDQLKRKAETGSLQPTNMVFCSGGEKWVLAQSIPGLFKSKNSPSDRASF